MSVFARINDDSIVTDVVIAPEQSDKQNLSWLQKNLAGVWLRSYSHSDVEAGKDTTRRGLAAGVGMIYDSELDAFYNPAPYPSWILNLDTFEWQAPEPMPTEDQPYLWDEATVSWQLVN